MLIRDLFRRQLEKTPEAVAVVSQDRALTWREIDLLSDRFAQGAFSLGVRKGDRVAGVLSNSAEFLICHLGLLKSGAVFVPMNPQLTGAHIEYIVNHSEAKLLLCDAELWPVVGQVANRLRTVSRFVSVGSAGPPDGTLAFEGVIALGEKSGGTFPSLRDDDVAAFLYTSGTTGDPKGVVHTHFSCGFVSEHWSRVFHMEPGKTVLMMLPLFHVFGLHCISLPALISGARLVIAERYRTESALEAVETHRVNVLPLVPAMATLMINHPDFARRNLSSLEVSLMGGAIVPFELLRQWHTALPKLELINGYGQTESCPCSTGLWDVDILSKPRSVGKPWDFVSLKILDDAGRELPRGEVGEIVYKVASVMVEYFKEPELTARTVRDGWLYSGDLGYVDEDGYVYVVDRKKDIIIRGGENISSMEIEEVLHRHPDVLEASAIGAPHPVLGETVMAVVVPKPGQTISEDDLRKFCEQHLERFKVPSRVEFADVLPRNPGGKVLKRELKSRYFGQSR